MIVQKTLILRVPNAVKASFYILLLVALSGTFTSMYAASGIVSIQLNPQTDTTITGIGTFSLGKYDAVKKEWISGIITDRHANRYADDFSENFNGVGLSIRAGRDDIDYAVSVGESIKNGLAEHGIPFEYFINIRNEKGFGATVYSNGNPSANIYTEEKVYSVIRVAVSKYKDNRDGRY